MITRKREGWAGRVGASMHVCILTYPYMRPPAALPHSSVDGRVCKYMHLCSGSASNAGMLMRDLYLKQAIMTSGLKLTGLNLLCPKCSLGYQS